MFFILTTLPFKLLFLLLVECINFLNITSVLFSLLVRLLLFFKYILL